MPRCAARAPERTGRSCRCARFNHACCVENRLDVSLSATAMSRDYLAPVLEPTRSCARRSGLHAQRCGAGTRPGKPALAGFFPRLHRLPSLRILHPGFANMNSDAPSSPPNLPAFPRPPKLKPAEPCRTVKGSEPRPKGAAYPRSRMERLRLSVRRPP